jgi:alkylation response protein AidB-like acyl-CoA dehydrogenase
MTMHFAFSEEQLAFRDSVREALRRECPPARVRAAWSGVRSPVAWNRLAELGVLGLLVPEAQGGFCGNEVDLVLPLEESGRAALPEPLVETALVAVALLRGTEWLPKIAAGQLRVAVGSDLVPHADVADVIIVERDGAMVAVARESAQLAAHSSVDGSRRLFAIEFTDGKPLAPVDWFDRGAFGTAAQLLGLGDQLLAMTIEYVKVRKQFGSAVGSFQAVKHQLADAHLALEFARPMVYRAAWSLAHEDPDRSTHASMAKAFTSDAAQRAARVALQCHGAIGYSFEYDLHLWLKRVWALAAAWGDAAWHRRRVGAALLGAAGPPREARGGSR